ncbi:MAG: hypothetical protein KHW46_05175 [Clostridiales bacterium]|nr:hypothetical protein [Clostridiales bacterium]
MRRGILWFRPGRRNGFLHYTPSAEKRKPIRPIPPKRLLLFGKIAIIKIKDLLQCPGKWGLGNPYAQKRAKFLREEQNVDADPKRGEKNEKRRGLRQRFALTA